MAREVLTDMQVELEIARLSESEAVKLAKAEDRIKNRRRQYMYSLRSLEKRGKQLLKEGYTLENISVLLGDEELEGLE